MTSRDYYLVDFIIDCRYFYTIWYSDDTDGFLLDGKGQIKSFENETEARRFALNNDLALDEEVLEISEESLKAAVSPSIDCNFVLIFWNLITDAACSVNREFSGNNRDAETMNVYDKLFYGCNIPAIRRGGEEYLPLWSSEEKELIAGIAEEGFRILRRALI